MREYTKGENSGGGFKFNVRATTVIRNREGVHARTAAIFVQMAEKFKSRIVIAARDKIVDAKSILMLVNMGLTCGTEITIMADGSDAFDAVASLKRLIDEKFGEE